MVSVQKREKPVIIPPVVLEEYEDFKNFAKDAVLVTYDVEFFNGPFLDDKKKLRRLTLHAVGVEIENVPLTMKYVLDYNSIEIRGLNWNQKTSELDSLVRTILEDLDGKVRLVRGTVESQPDIGAALSIGY